MQSAVPAPAPTSSTTATSTATSTATTTNPNAPENNLTLGTNATGTIGTFLIASNGMTLYTFDKDKTGTTTCYAKCATVWPPYTVPEDMENSLNVQAGITGKVETIDRADGTYQVTYNGKPLYFYQKDAAPGDTLGNGIGGVWHVAKQ